MPKSLLAFPFSSKRPVLKDAIMLPPFVTYSLKRLIS
jgi:hypothetical protein